MEYEKLGEGRTRVIYSEPQGATEKQEQKREVPKFKPKIKRLKKRRFKFKMPKGKTSERTRTGIMALLGVNEIKPKKYKRIRPLKRQRRFTKPYSYGMSSLVERDPSILKLKQMIAERQRLRTLTSAEYRIALQQRQRQLLNQHKSSYNILQASRNLVRSGFNVLDIDQNNILKTPNIFQEDRSNHVLRPTGRPNVLQAPYVFRN